MNVTWEEGKLHLACGAKYLDGWINSDVVPTPVVRGMVGHPDVVLDISHDLATIPEDTLSWIYWSHGVEHLPPNLLPGILGQLHRVLAPTGRLTLATTDLWKIVTRRFPDNNWEGPLFGHRYSTDSPWLSHLDCFTTEKLTRLLRNAGFGVVRPWKLEDYAEIRALNDYAFTHADVTLYLEAVK
jgi:predicted SAM-dependent methyltransferase